MDMTPYKEPLATEIEQIVDEALADCGLPPAKRKAAEGVRDMQARITYHTEQLEKLRSHPATPERLQFIAEGEQQLAEATQRLADYRLQLTGLN